MSLNCSSYLLYASDGNSNLTWLEKRDQNGNFYIDARRLPNEYQRELIVLNESCTKFYNLSSWLRETSNDNSKTQDLLERSDNLYASLNRYADTIVEQKSNDLEICKARMLIFKQENELKRQINLNLDEAKRQRDSNSIIFYNTCLGYMPQRIFFLLLLPKK